ncbi:hypothetical protein CEW87_03955 [Parazoarcus communis]|uniref:SGNH hydrolase-type esterase domain-containing protein n=1 Tax=Parazoarcus communis TaxID=41977 RepID=A0A2U8GY04_9RHOO|nr:SGNH/GDSL hydrolase family protein [Parazoarcus communis]AWI78587.1 hypothetical protein CEW87_03955 [Parazoarcus communis]
MTVRRTAAERATAAVGTVINGTPLYVKTNELTGVSVSAGATPIGLPGSPVKTLRRINIPCGEFATHTVAQAAHRTYRAATAFKSRPRRVRLWFANADSATAAITSCAISPSTNGALTANLWSSSSSSWISGGAVSIPARIAVGRPSMAASAWMQIDAVESVTAPGTWPVLAEAWVDTTSGPANVTIGFYDMGWAESDPLDGGTYYAHRWQDGDKFTVPSSFSDTTIRGAGAIIGMEAECDEGSTVVLVNGDSIRAGAGTTRAGETDAMIAVRNMNLAGYSVSYIALGWGGLNTSTYSARLIENVATLKPDVVVYTVGSPNDGTPAATVLRIERFNMHAAISASRAAGAAVILSAQAPNTSYSWNASADDLRKALNAGAAAMASPSALRWYAHAVAGLGDGATPERYAPTYTTDNNHPNQAGYEYASINMQTVLTGVIKSIGHAV